jgi:hypothetical protein
LNLDVELRDITVRVEEGAGGGSDV